MKDKLTAVFAVIIGAGLLVMGISQMSEDSVSCGDEKMDSAQTCVEFNTNSGSSQSRSIADQRDENTKDGWISVAIGAAMFLGGGAWAISQFRSRSTDTSRSVSTYPGAGLVPPRSGADSQLAPPPGYHGRFEDRSDGAQW